MTKQTPTGRPVADPGQPARYNGPTGNPRESKSVKPPVDQSQIPGTDVIVSSGIKIQRDGMTITPEGCSQIVTFCIKNKVGKDMSLSEAARRLSVHRHTIRAVLRRFDNGEVGAISENQDISFDEFEEMIIDDLVSSYLTRQELLAYVDKELYRRITETPEEISAKDLINLKKLDNQITMNTAAFLTDKQEREHKVNRTNHPITNDQVTELRQIFSNAAKRLEKSEDKNIVIDG